LVAQTDAYVCPSCKGPLARGGQAFDCRVCQATYPIVDSIPDFVGQELDSRISPAVRAFLNVPLIARVYETKLWYPVILRIFGGSKAPSFEQLMGKVGAMMAAESGMVLDVACGPGTLGRRIASPTRTVYGVDISWSMLRQGAAYVTQEGIGNVQFARASADELPFPDAFFNVALCGGALHLFPDTVAVLREIACVMKPGCPACGDDLYACARWYPALRAHPRARPEAGRPAALRTGAARRILDSGRIRGLPTAAGRLRHDLRRAQASVAKSDPERCSSHISQGHGAGIRAHGDAKGRPDASPRR
jgi:SAM-dependent methyltransferase